MGKTLTDKFRDEKEEINLEKVKIYTYDEAFEASTKYFNGDSMAAGNFLKKYALKDAAKSADKNAWKEVNFYEATPDQMHWRIAKEIARIEYNHAKKGGLAEENVMSSEEVFELLDNFKYVIPGGSNMSGIGNDKQIVSLSNCFVIRGPSDSYGGIIRTDQEQVQLMKRRGGVGHDLSNLRPAATPVKNSAITSTGIVPFMDRYSNSTREVAQDGRRGALMLSLPVEHPEAENFVDAKLEQGKVTGANLSVKLDDRFMNAVKNNEKYLQRFPVGSENPTFEKELDARKFWDKIMHNAWASAEPGVLFWDTIAKESVPDRYAELGFESTSTNPCGEIPLCPDDSCRLISMNLYSYVDNPFTDNAEFNYKKFENHARKTQRIMDDIIDLEVEKIDAILEKIDKDPEEEEDKQVERRLWERIKKKTEQGRRSGIGITAEGDMIAAMGLTYGTPEATKLATEVHRKMALAVYGASIDLAEERGAFPIYDAELEKGNPFIERLREEDSGLVERMEKNGRRNIALLTIAPTGTVSQMAQTTSGIEPAFMISYIRSRKVNPNDKNVKVAYTDNVGDAWEEYNVFHHKFEDWLIAKGHDVEKVKKYGKEELEELIKKSPYYKATSKDVDWVEKVNMQGSIQKWVDHSISVTVNVPEDFPEDKVSDIYMVGWESGCKGITIYRDGSRGPGVMRSGDEKETPVLVQKNVTPHPILDIKPQAIKYSVKRSFDRLHIIPTSDLYIDDKNNLAYFLPDEDFQNRIPLGAATSVSFAQSGVDRSSIFRSIDPDYVDLIRQWQSNYSDEAEGIGPSLIKSTDHAVGIVFEDYLLRNGVIMRNAQGKLEQVVRKRDLRKVEPGTDEYKAIVSQVRLGAGDDEEEIEVSGQNGKMDSKFVCQNPDCGKVNDYHFESGCSNPICSCGWSDPDKAC
jgi:ribonucleoside-diphosphate reductase alpha chain